MNFLASITRDPNEICKMQRLWQSNKDKRNPLEKVLITPLFTPPSTLKLLRRMREDGEIEQIVFDSGGYFVQTGRISYEEMYWQLLQFYRDNQWADWYVLPDYVPLSSDREDEVWYKVFTTADRSKLFYSEMPASLREKALPVIQGRTIEQIEYCLEVYLELGIKTVGFGSFGTNGKASSVNTLTNDSLLFLKHLTSVLRSLAISLHAFGVGTPPVIFLLHKSGVYSFDSVGWMKTAGYGKIYMPFIRAYNITYRDSTARGLTEHKFYELRERTKHECPFCTSFTKLVSSRDYRVMHNLTVVLDTVAMLDRQDDAFIRELLEDFSPTYAKLLEGVFK